jgi:hypothetical protein
MALAIVLTADGSQCDFRRCHWPSDLLAGIARESAGRPASTLGLKDNHFAGSAQYRD